VIPFPSGLEKTPQATPQVEDARVKKKLLNFVNNQDQEKRTPISAL